MAGRLWAPLALLLCWGGCPCAAAALGTKCPPFRERLKNGTWATRKLPELPVYKHLKLDAGSCWWFEPGQAEECGGLTLSQGDIDWFRAKYRHPLFIGDSVTRDFYRVFTQVVSPAARLKEREALKNKGAARTIQYRYIVYAENSGTKNESEYRDFPYFRVFYTHIYDDMLAFLRRRPVPDLILLNVGLHFMVPKFRMKIYTEVAGVILKLLRDHAPNATLVWTDTTPQHNSKKPKEHRKKQTNRMVLDINRMARELLETNPGYRPERDLQVEFFTALHGKSRLPFSVDGVHWKPIVDIVRTALTIRLLRDKAEARA